ncbi:MAG: transglycosylase SLT domain-containing protein [Pseudomonadota bacterium]
MSDPNRLGAIGLLPGGTPIRPAAIQPSAPAGGSDAVSRAIRGASQRTGVDFGYLLATAKKESSLDPDAKARTSSATGLYQFIDQTWLGMLKESGAAHGYAAEAEAISGSPGRYRVAPHAREAVMALRYDPGASAAMAAELTQNNAASLRRTLGRAPTRGELYIAHVMGPTNGGRLIALGERNPGADASAVFPRAAAANKAIFYAKGAPRSAAQVVAILARGLEGVADDGSGQILKARAEARTWWDMMGRIEAKGGALGVPTPGLGKLGAASPSPSVGMPLPRHRLDAEMAPLRAARAYGSIHALSR